MTLNFPWMDFFILLTAFTKIKKKIITNNTIIANCPNRRIILLYPIACTTNIWKHWFWVLSPSQRYSFISLDLDASSIMFLTLRLRWLFRCKIAILFPFYCFKCAKHAILKYGTKNGDFRFIAKTIFIDLVKRFYIG